jgi:hypothetical protein
MSGAALLRLARSDRAGARARITALALDAQLSACLEVRPESRIDLLMLLDRPEAVVRRIPETEFCVTARATGMSEAAWLLEMSTNEQMQACVDLDCWVGSDLACERVVEWLGALTEAGPETMERALQSLDPEVVILAVRSLSEVAVLGKEDLRPDGWFTLDGVVYFGPHERVDPADLRALIQAAYTADQTSYWKIVYGTIFESETECEEYALRWRTGRLQDLGFPDREQAMRLYRPLRPADVETRTDSVPTSMPVVVERLPAQLAGTLVGEALGKLSPQRAGDILGYVLSVANAVAVADGLSLSASESIPRALEKTVRAIDVGLGELSRLRNEPAHEILDQIQPLDLFRVGATVDPDLRRS